MKSVIKRFYIQPVLVNAKVVYVYNLIEIGLTPNTFASARLLSVF